MWSNAAETVYPWYPHTSVPWGSHPVCFQVKVRKGPLYGSSGQSIPPEWFSDTYSCCLCYPDDTKYWNQLSLWCSRASIHCWFTRKQQAGDNIWDWHSADCYCVSTWSPRSEDQVNFERNVERTLKLFVDFSILCSKWISELVTVLYKWTFLNFEEVST